MMTNYWGLFFIMFVPWIFGMGIGYVCGQEEAKKKTEKNPGHSWEL